MLNMCRYFQVFTTYPLGQSKEWGKTAPFVKLFVFGEQKAITNQSANITMTTMYL